MTAESIVVFRTGQLGDTIVSLPAIAAIRSAHPGVPMVLFTERQSGKGFVSPWDILGKTGWFSSVLVRNPGDGLLVHWRLARALRVLPAPRLYYLPHMPRSGRQVARDRIFFRAAGGVRQLMGMRPTGPYPVRCPDGTLRRLSSESHRLLGWIRDDLPGTQAASLATATPVLPLAPGHRKHASELLARVGFDRFPVVTVGPGSKWDTTRWPEERFLDVGRRLLAEDESLRLVVVGGSADRAIGERLCAAWGPRATSVAGLLGVFESAALIERAIAHVGNDTGTLHLAASVGTPTVGIFSARDNPGKWEPAGTGHAVLRDEPSCAGCYRTTCLHSSVKCLLAISPADVCGRMRPLLNASVGRRRVLSHA